LLSVSHANALYRFQGDKCFLEEYPDFEIGCVADGDGLDVDLIRFDQITRGDSGGSFEGRQLEKKKKRRLIFARPVRPPSLLLRLKTDKELSL
jgi:hypothetical protein